MSTKIYAVDFDGVVTKHSRYPNLGEPNIEMIRWLKQKQGDGVKLILWTCREGNLLDDALTFCKAYGLEFDAVNENLPEMIQQFGNDCRKVFAHLYIDDCCRTPWEIIDKGTKDRKEKIVMTRRKARIVR